MSSKQIWGLGMLVLSMAFFISAGICLIKDEDYPAEHIITRGYILLCNGIILTT